MGRKPKSNHNLSQTREFKMARYKHPSKKQRLVKKGNKLNGPLSGLFLRNMEEEEESIQEDILL